MYVIMYNLLIANCIVTNYCLDTQLNKTEI